MNLSDVIYPNTNTLYSQLGTHCVPNYVRTADAIKLNSIKKRVTEKSSATAEKNSVVQIEKAISTGSTN